jgi:hypothetical protein
MEKSSAIRVAAILFGICCLSSFIGCSSPDSPSAPPEPADSSHTLLYSANGGMGSVPVDSATYTEGQTVTILANASLEKSKFNFVGWNTKADGSGTTYASGSKLSFSSSSNVLYALWFPTYVQFQCNGSTVDFRGFDASVTGAAAIPMGVTTISYGSCGNSTSISIPATVTKIWGYVDSGGGGLVPYFSLCPNLISISVDSANPFFSSKDGCLLDKTGTTLLVVPEGITGTFVTPSGVTSIEPYAFRVGSHITNLTIGKTITDIPTAAEFVNFQGNCFAGMPKLQAITVDGTNVAYESIDGILYNKSGSALLQVPLGLSLASFTIPPSVTTIGFGAFDYTNLTTIVIPPGVTTIEKYALSLGKLTTITLPDSATTIDYNAFYGCGLLVDLWMNEPTLHGPVSLNNCGATLKIHVPAACLSLYLEKQWLSGVANMQIAGF